MPSTHSCRATVFCLWSSQVFSLTTVRFSEALPNVDRLQFSGSSAVFKSLVTKAFELGNLRLEHAGEVSGLNKVRLDGVSASHPAVVAGSAFAAMANNGELSTSASLIEFDP